MVEKKENSKDRFALVEVPTEFGFAIQDNEKGTRVDEKSVLVEILNKLDRIEKNVG